MSERQRNLQSSCAPSKVSERPLHPLWRVPIVFAAAAVIGIAIHQGAGALFAPGYALGVLLVERLHRDPPGWLDGEPDRTAPAGGSKALR